MTEFDYLAACRGFPEKLAIVYRNICTSLGRSRSTGIGRRRRFRSVRMPQNQASRQKADELLTNEADQSIRASRIKGRWLIVDIAGANEGKGEGPTVFTFRLR